MHRVSFRRRQVDNRADRITPIIQIKKILFSSRANYFTSSRTMALRTIDEPPRIRLKYYVLNIVLGFARLILRMPTEAASNRLFRDCGI